MGNIVGLNNVCLIIIENFIFRLLWYLGKKISFFEVNEFYYFLVFILFFLFWRKYLK